MITALALAAAFASPIMQKPGAEPATAVAAQWNTLGFAPRPADRGAGGTESSSIVLAFLRGGGLLGGAKPGTNGVAAWSSAVQPLELNDEDGLAASPDAPQGWFGVSAAARESGGAVFTLNLNAVRTGNEKLFDAPWVQRTLHRLALDNARLISIRGAVQPPPSDHLPPMLEVRAFASARSVSPGPARPVTLVAPGWTGTPAEAAAVEKANWAASLRFDSGGLGAIGRDGGVGTLAGLIRLCVDLVGTAGSADTAAWAKTYTAWQERSGDEVRSLSTRLQQRATLACYGNADAPELVLIIPARRGERAETLKKAMDQLAACGGISAAKDQWTLNPSGPLTPPLTATVCDAGAGGVFLVASLERSGDHRLMRLTVDRLGQSK